MHHGILGAGGVGGLVGAALAHAGEQVTLIVRPESLAQQPRTLSLESKLGTFNVSVSVSAQTGASLDVLWITVKATQLQSALQSIPATTRIGAVVPLLNGIDHVQLLRGRFGHDRVIPATIAVESERTAPGVIVHRSPWIRLNAALAGHSVLEPAFDELRRFGFECNFIDNEITLLWSKLAFLAPIALSTTAAAAPIGDVIGNPARRNQLEECVREACAVANASGAALDPDTVLGNVGKLPPQMRSSMQKDVAAGRAPELDAIAGPILHGGKEHGLPTPATRQLVDEIQTRMRSAKQSD